MGKRICIVQSNYIPWKGYFDLIRASDDFVIYDDVQYTKNDWRNRNRIKTQAGTQWLTIPVRQTDLRQTILETVVADSRWRNKHWSTLQQTYGKTPYFSLYRERIKSLYLDDSAERLTDVNERFLREICDLLGVTTQFHRVERFALPEGKTERLVELCRQLGARQYLSGPAARSYLDESLFTAAGIEVVYADYSGYPEYEQTRLPFEHSVSVLDLLFHTGPAAAGFLKDVTSPQRSELRQAG